MKILRQFKSEIEDTRRQKDLSCSQIGKQYCKNDFYCQSDLSVQCNPQSNSNDISHRTSMKKKSYNSNGSTKYIAKAILSRKDNMRGITILDHMLDTES